MRKILTFLLVTIAVLLSACSPTPICEITTAIIKTLINGSENICFGIIYDSNYILTVAHIFPQSYDRTPICAVIDKNGNQCISPAVCIDFENDLALIAYKNNAKPIIFTNFDNPLFVKNNSFFAKSTKNSMTKSDIKNKPDRLLKMSVAVAEGSSGSAVITADGKMVGMVCAKSADGKFAYAVPSDVIAEFIAKNRQDKDGDFFADSTG